MRAALVLLVLPLLAACAAKRVAPAVPVITTYYSYKLIGRDTYLVIADNDKQFEAAKAAVGCGICEVERVPEVVAVVEVKVPRKSQKERQ